MKQSVRFFLIICFLVTFVVPSFCWDDTQYFHVDTYPIDVYVIGDFNDWKLPVKEDLNGAIQMYRIARTVNDYDGHQNHYTTYYSISSLEMFPKGDSRLVVYAADDQMDGFYHDESLTSVFGNNAPPFPFYLQYDPSVCIEKNRVGKTKCSQSLNIDRAFLLKDWNGGNVYVGINSDYKQVGINRVKISSLNESFTIAPENIYLKCEINNEPAELLKCDSVNDQWGHRTSSFEIRNLSGSTFKILLSTENSKFNESEKSFGALYPDSIMVDDDMNFVFPIIEDGYPIDIRLKCNGNLNLEIDPLSKYIDATVTDMNVSVNTIAQDYNSLRYEENQIKLGYMADVRIYDMVGKLILMDYTSEVDISSLVPGVYIVKSGFNTLKIKK